MYLVTDTRSGLSCGIGAWNGIVEHSRGGFDRHSSVESGLIRQSVLYTTMYGPKFLVIPQYYSTYSLFSSSFARLFDERIRGGVQGLISFLSSHRN